MITLVNFKESFIKNSTRILKVIQWGTKTADECAPFGDDSNPLEDMIAVYAETSENGEPVIIGYINENQIAAQGEKRMYSLKEDGTVSAYLWLKNDGKVLLNGDNDNLVKYLPLQNDLTQTSALINAELTKIQAALTSVGAVYVPAPLEINIENAKAKDLFCD